MATFDPYDGPLSADFSADGRAQCTASQGVAFRIESGPSQKIFCWSMSKRLSSLPKISLTKELISTPNILFSKSETARKFFRPKRGLRPGPGPPQRGPCRSRLAPLAGVRPARSLAADPGETFLQLPGTRFELVTNGFSDHYSTD